MDSETMQFLNLSPIPELSELELSTMLDQLSGLSDINGDLTDRNVEDILKEAEDLIDKSSSSKDNKSIYTSKKGEDMTKNEVEMSPDLAEPNEIIVVEQEPCLKSEIQVSVDNIQNNDINEPHSPPVQQIQEKIFQSNGPANHIKSTIDSLKEFSDMIEKQICSSSQSSSPKSKCRTDTKKKEKEECTNLVNKIISKDDQLSQNSNLSKLKSFSSDLKSPKVVRHSTDYFNKNVDFDSVNMSKAVKYLNCFERLYQSKPVRLCGKKPKIPDKVPKTIIKKKNVKDSNSLSSPFAVRDKKQTKCVSNKRTLSKGIRNESIMETRDQNVLPKTQISKKLEVEDWLMKGDSNDLIFELSDHKLISQLQGFSEGESESEVSLKYSGTDEKKSSPKVVHKTSTNSGVVHLEKEEKLILKLLQEMEEIKNHIRMTGGVRNDQNHEKITKECQTVIEERLDIHEQEERMQNAGIRQLEEKFLMVKAKYDQQIEKLETENENLRELLSSQQNVSLSQRRGNKDVSTSTDDRLQEEIKNSRVLPDNTLSSHAEVKIVPSISLKNCQAPLNCTCSDAHSSQEESQVVNKEASSQTENDLKNASIQCHQEDRYEERNLMKDGAIDCEGVKKDSETRKMENKENLLLKKKASRTKPFSDVHQLMKQKKVISDHETQLLATLRGLQAEVMAKDKENRKLKAEMDMLRTQIKRLTKNKSEGPKKCHIGTQTVGLGPVVQKPYDPSVYEVPDDLEKENEELKSKLKVLEDGFELLKEKRINDLQTLHQVHQEEMAKLVSRLETQSALTKHFHSLLVNH